MKYVIELRAGVWQAPIQLDRWAATVSMQEERRALRYWIDGATYIPAPEQQYHLIELPA